MSTTREYADYAADQLSGAGNVTLRKMFGDYGVYLNGKFMGVLCDNQLYIKPTGAGKAVLPDAEEAPPFEGARPWLMAGSLDDRELMTRFLIASFEELPWQKPKKKRPSRGSEKGL